MKGLNYLSTLNRQISAVKSLYPLISNTSFIFLKSWFHLFPQRVCGNSSSILLTRQSTVNSRSKQTQKGKNTKTSTHLPSFESFESIRGRFLSDGRYRDELDEQRLRCWALRFPFALAFKLLLLLLELSIDEFLLAAELDDAAVR